MRKSLVYKFYTELNMLYIVYLIPVSHYVIINHTSIVVSYEIIQRQKPSSLFMLKAVKLAATQRTFYIKKTKTKIQN